MREYILGGDSLNPNGGLKIMCKDDRDCVFCDHCTDVWWDYTHLIYMIACAEDHDPLDRPCKYFTEGKENG